MCRVIEDLKISLDEYVLNKGVNFKELCNENCSNYDNVENKVKIFDK
mgnify:CR=1 FL=1